MDEGTVHHALTGTHLDGRHGWIGTIAALRRAFDGREILLVVVAVAKEEEVIQSGAALQTERMAAEELAGDADKTDPAVEKRCGEMRSHAFAVLALEEVHQSLKEGRHVDGFHARMTQVNSALEM